MNAPANDGLPPVIDQQPFMEPCPNAPSGSPAAPKGPWGFWATIGFTCVIAAGYLAAQVVVGVIHMIVSAALNQGRSPSGSELNSSGVVMALATMASAPVAVSLAVLFARLRKALSITEYLALTWPGVGSAARWIGALLVLIVISDTLTVGLGRPIVPDVMVDLYRQPWAPPLLWITLLVAAPVSEEFVFRGFLFTGLRNSRPGGLGAILITSAVWASIHLQYDLYGIAMIFLGGILLGYARLRTGSLWLCVMMHALMNLICTLQIEFLVP